MSDESLSDESLSDESTVPTGADDAAVDDPELDAYDLDGDGEIGVIEAQRARIGLVDARMEEIADEGGVKGFLAEAAHKVLDALDNDGEHVEHGAGKNDDNDV